MVSLVTQCIRRQVKGRSSAEDLIFSSMNSGRSLLLMALALLYNLYYMLRRTVGKGLVSCDDPNTEGILSTKFHWLQF